MIKVGRRLDLDLDIDLSFLGRSERRFLGNITLFIFANGLLPYITEACDLKRDLGVRTCPTSFTYAAKGNKCLYFSHYSRGKSYFEGDRGCRKVGGYLVIIGSSEENEGVHQFLKTRLAGQRPATGFWIGIGTNLYADGTSFDRTQNYTNFENNRGRGCVVMRLQDGKWRSIACISSQLGAICEVKPELHPQRPNVSISGVRRTRREMRVQNKQRLAVTCVAKIGPKGWLNFVKKKSTQAWVIHELSHVGVKRTQSTQIIDGSCYIISRAVMAFHILKDMENHTIGCVSDNVTTSNRCTQWDPYCILLPGVFKVDGTIQHAGHIDTFPVSSVNLPRVPPIVLTNDELTFQSLPAQFRGGGGGGGSGTRNTMISTRGPPIGRGGGGSGTRNPNWPLVISTRGPPIDRPFVNATREPPTDRTSLRLLLFIGPPVFLLAVATAVCFSQWGKGGKQLGEGEEAAPFMNPDVFYIFNEEESSIGSTMGRSSRSTWKSSSKSSGEMEKDRVDQMYTTNSSSTIDEYERDISENLVYGTSL